MAFDNRDAPAAAAAVEKTAGSAAADATEESKPVWPGLASGSAVAGLRFAAVERWLILGMVLYFAAQALVRATGAAALELDESELVVVGQWWLAGYTNQPPLYVWLQTATFRVLGLDLTALSVLKNTLLFLTYLFTFLSARRLLGEPLRAVLATLSLLLIAQLAWEAQRDLSHSVMVTTVSAASFYALLRWYEHPSTAGYLILGVLVGLGLLSKYNYVLFVGAVLLTLLSDPRGRMLLLDWRTLLGSALMAAIVAPHLIWLSGDPELVSELPHKLDFGQRVWLVSGLGSTSVALLDFLAPWWVIMLLVFRGDLVRALAARPSGAGFPLRRYLGFLLLLLGVLLLVGASHFKARWMLPLALVAPIFVFAVLPATALTSRRVRAYITACIAAAAAVLLVMAWRQYDWPVPAGREALARHYDGVAAQARASGFENGLIVADRLVDAGNLRLRFAGSAAWAPRVNGAALACTAGSDLLVVWEPDGLPGLPVPLRDLLTRALAVPAAEIDRALGQASSRPAAASNPAVKGRSDAALLTWPKALGEDCRWGS